jgi:threonine dehydrogenase-like Zn-dependent dehydrogenase
MGCLNAFLDERSDLFERYGITAELSCLDVRLRFVSLVAVATRPCRRRTREWIREMKSNVAVFGAGYIGLVTGACLAELGHTVAVRDIVPDRIEILQAGDIPIFEPGLGDLITQNKDRLTFTLDAEEAVRDAEIVYVCVDTPPMVSGDADLSRVWAVIEMLKSAPYLAAVVVKSTVPVGTGERVRAAPTRPGSRTSATPPTPSSPPRAGR